MLLVPRFPLLIKTYGFCPGLGCDTCSLHTWPLAWFLYSHDWSVQVFILDVPLDRKRSQLRILAGSSSVEKPPAPDYNHEASTK